MSDPGRLSYEELASRVLAAEGRAGAAEALVEELSGANVRLAGQLQVALEQIEVLRRAVGRDSSNSSRPPGGDGLGARASKDAKKREQRERRQAEQEAKSATAAGRRRVRGGQVGHEGSGLEWRAVPDEVVVVEPGACSGCGVDLQAATVGPARVARRVQVVDVPPVTVACTEYRALARRCPGCGAVTTARMPPVVPAGVAGGTCYGSNLRAMAAFAGSAEVMGVARAATFVGALAGAPVSTGFISGCLARLDAALSSAGFEDALKQALRAAAVLGTDETPVRLSLGEREGAPNAQVFTVRTMHAATPIAPGAGRGGYQGAAAPPGDLIWCGAGPTRAGAVIDSFGVLPGYGGVLVRDDYGGYLKYEEDLGGVQQCVAHLRRYLADAAGMGDAQRQWCAQADRALCEAITAVRAARAAGMNAPDAALSTTLTQLRREYDAATAVGRSVNINATWPKGTHPALALARRLGTKAEQVWLFASRFDVPATNNASEGAIRGVKVIQKISGIWRTLDTLQASMRIRSYLATTTSHGIDAITAIRRALDGNPWMPPALTA